MLLEVIADVHADLRQAVFFDQREDGGLDRGQVRMEPQEVARLAVDFILIVGIDEEGQRAAVDTGGRLNDVGDVTLAGFFLKIRQRALQVVGVLVAQGDLAQVAFLFVPVVHRAHAALMLTQVEIGAVGDAFQFLPVAGAEGEFVFDIDAGLGIVGQFVGVVVAEAQVIFFDAQVQIPVEPLLFPVAVPIHIGAGLAEEFQLGLFELACAEDEGLGGDFIAEGLADLGDAEGNLDAGGVQHVAEVGKDALCGFRPQEECHRIVGVGAHLGFEHQPKRHRLVELADRAAGRADLTAEVVFFGRFDIDIDMLGVL